MKPGGRLQEDFVEDFHKELAEIESPVARHVFILGKANHLMHLRIAEYVALIGLQTGSLAAYAENTLKQKI